MVRFLQILFKGQTFSCKKGENLRTVLLKNKFTPHNGNSEWFNCRGLGTCGTCALKVHGDVSPPTSLEKARLNFPPHTADEHVRLACQCKVLGDLQLEKGTGFWGEHFEESPVND